MSRLSLLTYWKLGDIVIRLEASGTNFLDLEILDCSLRY